MEKILHILMWMFLDLIKKFPPLLTILSLCLNTNEK